MCKGDENGCLPIIYFKEIRNIQTGEQIEVKSDNIIDKTKHDKRLNPLVQNYVPNRPTGMTPITIPSEQVQEPKRMPVTTYCVEHYDAEHAWKDIQAEQAEYIELLTVKNENFNIIQKSISGIPTHTRCIPNMPCIPTQAIISTNISPVQRESDGKNIYKQYTTYYQTHDFPVYKEQVTTSEHTTYHIPTDTNECTKETQAVTHKQNSPMTHEEKTITTK